jgi:DNA-binding transcriptional MocR family regulator
MSYKVRLTGLERGGATSLTQQLVARFAEAIDAGELAPGEKLPTTRAVAAEAGINHLTAARVYRQLAEEGYVTARVGAGTFVRALPPGAADDADEDADAFQALVLPDYRPSVGTQALLEASRVPDEGTIALAMGWTDPGLAPREELAALAAEAFAEAGDRVLGYSPPEGLPELRRVLGERGAAEGWAAGPEEILVTSGATQGLNLALRAIAEQGDAVVVESPSFIGTLDALRDIDVRILPVPVDEQGLSVEALERHLRRHEIRVLALQPSCHNPTGYDLAAERRERILELARERSFLVLEDRVYANLRFEGHAARSLRADAPAHVVTVDSVSKSLAGGLRLGWVTARPPVLARMAAFKLRADMHTSGLPQEIVARWLASGRHEAYLARTVPVYRERCAAMLEALRRELGREIRFTRPAGGHHVWVTFRRPVDEQMLHAEAAREGVAFLPGAAALADPTVASGLRLSFAVESPERIREGVARLTRALRRTRERELAGSAVLRS